MLLSITRRFDCAFILFVGSFACMTQSLVLMKSLDVQAMSRGTPTALTQPAFSEPHAWEVPAHYTQREAMSRAFTESFDSRAIYERQIQARHAARASYLNLLPHLSMSSILSAVAPSVTGLLGAIGDLVPFLLPNRWLQAKSAAHQSQAQRQALALMRADAAAQVEGLSYALERDFQILAHYRTLMDLAVQTRDKLQRIELSGGMPEGSTDHLNATINWMSLDVSALESLIHGDRMALAQAMGFSNPEAILELTLDPEVLPIDVARPLDTEPLSRAALAHSYEVAQMTDLIAVAAVQKREVYFNWLDPAGDYTAALGFGLADQIAVGRSRIRELQIRREQLQAAIAQKIAGAVAQYDGALLSFPVVKEGVALSDRRMTRVLSQITPGSPLNTLDIEAVFQDTISCWIRYETILAGFRVARSLIDRSLLQGVYAQLTQPPHPPQR